MKQEPQGIQKAQFNVSVPEKDFSRWLREESKNTRLKILCDLAKESFPYLTLLLLVIIACFVPREVLMFLAPILLVWLLRNLKNRGE